MIKWLRPNGRSHNFLEQCGYPINETIYYACRHAIDDDRAGDCEHLGGGAENEAFCLCPVRTQYFLQKYIHYTGVVSLSKLSVSEVFISIDFRFRAAVIQSFIHLTKVAYVIKTARCSNAC